MAAAAIIFFAFYGFDAIATAAEEAKNPSRDLAIGIVGSMVVCVLDLHGRRGRGDRRGRLHRLRQQPRAARADPARDRPAVGGAGARRVGGDRACRPSSSPSSTARAGSSSRWRATACCRSSLARVSRRGTPVRITVFTAVVTSVFAGLIPLDGDRRAGQCRDAGGVHRGVRGDAGAAPPRARPRAQVPRARRAPLVGDRSASSAASTSSSACPTARRSSSSPRR